MHLINMAIIKRCLLLSLLLHYFLPGMTQTARIDSIRKTIYNTRSDDDRLTAIVKLCNEYKSLNRDTLDRYAYVAHEMGARTPDRRLKDEAELALAYDYYRWGWMDSVAVTVDPLIRNNKVTSETGRDIYFKASRLKAMSLGAHSRFQEGLAILYKVVSEAEAYRDTLTLAENFNSIASVALARGQVKDAFTWLSRAVALDTKGEGFRPIKAAVFVNLAEAYHQSGQTDSAQRYIGMGIALFRETGILSNLALALQRQSSMLIDAGKLDEAEQALKDMVTARRQVGDGDIYQDENLAIVNFYIQTKQMEKAIQTCKRLLRVGDLHTVDSTGGESTFANNINIRLGYYEALAKCYKIVGQKELYSQALEDVIAAKDSFYQYNSARDIAELETKYEVQKKENTIIQQQLDITKKNNRFYAFLGLAFFVAVISVTVFTGYRKREKLRLHAILEKEKVLAEQSVIRAEENERKRIAADLHDNLGAHAASIVSNLDLIELGAASPATHTAVQELRNNSLAIVSQLNDTIWALKRDALSLTALSDRVKVFIQRLRQSYPAVSIGVVEEIGDDLVMSPSHALHLFRIVQEAINNALRHSRALEISVAIRSQGNEWEISVEDDGRGMPGNRGMGNGLANMKERAEKSGWKICWLPGDPRGTVVKINNVL